LENDMIFSDIILPSNTMFEEDDILAASWAANQVNWAALVKHCIEPVGESKGDWDIVVAIAEKMGVADAVTDGQTNEEKIKAVYDSTPLSDLIAWDKLNEKQYMLMPCPEDWQNGSDAPLAFYTDPVNNPLGTPTGLLEFTSYNISEYLPDDKERPIHPTWVEGGSATDGWAHDERIDGERFEAYPLLLVSNHPRWRMHVQCDDSTWIREIRTCKIKGHDGYMYEPVWMHPDDAADRGLEDGDIVKVYNERGTVLGAVYITQRIIKGAVLQDHGAHVDLICDGVDRGGSNNLISPPNTTSKNCAGMATSGFLVQVEKVTGEQMQEWRETYPEAFARAYDPACGLKFEAWVTDEEEK
jgi:trimethylamine-N-oxide reductase (cytochrome c)